MVDADADGGPAALAYLNQGGELGARLGMVFMEIAGIDTDFIDVWGHFQGRSGREVYVCHYRGLNPLRTQLFAHCAYMRDILQTGNCDAYHLSARFMHPATLLEGRLLVACMGITHRLDDDGGGAAQNQGLSSYADLTGFEPCLCHKLYRMLPV